MIKLQFKLPQALISRGFTRRTVFHAPADKTDWEKTNKNIAEKLHLLNNEISELSFQNKDQLRINIDKITTKLTNAINTVLDQNIPKKNYQSKLCWFKHED